MRQWRRWARMQVVEIFLPLKRNDGSAQPRALFTDVRCELVERFGGLTAFSRAPAEGLWEDEAGHVDRDQMVIFEVTSDAIDSGWWSAFRTHLEDVFQQKEILIRASPSERL